MTQYWAISFFEPERLQLDHVVDDVIMVELAVNVCHPAWLDFDQCCHHLMDHAARTAQQELAWSKPDRTPGAVVLMTSEVVPA